MIIFEDSKKVSWTSPLGVERVGLESHFDLRTIENFSRANINSICRAGDDNQKPSWLKPPPDWKDKSEEYFAKPEAIADEVFHIAHQDRSTWSFDHIIRPYAEKW